MIKGCHAKEGVLLERKESASEESSLSTSSQAVDHGLSTCLKARRCSCDRVKKQEKSAKMKEKERNVQDHHHCGSACCFVSAEEQKDEKLKQKQTRPFFFFSVVLVVFRFLTTSLPSSHTMPRVRVRIIEASNLLGADLNGPFSPLLSTNKQTTSLFFFFFLLTFLSYFLACCVRVDEQERVIRM